MIGNNYQVQAILFTRFAWRPPSKSVVIKRLTIFSASPSRTKRAGIQIILASLCFLTRLAISSPQQMAARMPWCLLAVMATPLAVPQSKIPNAASPLSTATGNRMGKVGIINRIFAMCTKVCKRKSFSFQKRNQIFFIIISCMVAADGDGLAEIKWGMHKNSSEL